MKEQMKEKGVTPYNVMNNRVAKVALVASLLLTGVTTTISTVGPSNGIIGEWMEVNRAEAASVFAGGSGTVADPYVVSNPIELNQVRNFNSSHFILGSDIDLSGISWTPIENLNGSFDGNNHVIKGLTITTNQNDVGLFGRATGMIKNLHLIDVNIETTGRNVGAVVGEAKGNIDNVTVRGGSIKGGDYVGGIAGYYWDLYPKLNFSNSHADISVFGTSQVGGAIGYISYIKSNSISSSGNVTASKGSVGGLFGSMDYGSLLDSYATGDVVGKANYTGGLVGYQQYSSIDRVFATGDVSGAYSTGGLIGSQSDTMGVPMISNAIATGNVTSTEDNVGGLIGTQSGPVSNVYATGTVKGRSVVGGIVGFLNGASLSKAYAFNKSVSGSGAGKTVGYFLNSSVSGVYASTSLTTGNNNNMTGTVTSENALKENTYSFNGFEFGHSGNSAIWGIKEGESLPYLLFKPYVLIYNPETGELEEEKVDSALNEALVSVIKAEGSKLQEDVDAARGLVNLLPDGLDKTNLTNRLDAVQKKMDADKALQDAKDAVDKLGDYPTQEELDAVKDKVDALPDSPEKDELLNQIKDKQEALDQENADKSLAEQIAKATEAVVKAEGSQTQIDMDTARVLVNKLPDGEVKTDLTYRLDAIEQATDEDKALEEAKDAVDNLGDNPSQEELDKVKDKVDELSDGPAKDIILDQIKEKQETLNQTNATKAVEKAETSKKQVDINAARDLVKKLSDGEVKTDLTNRLDVLQQAIDTAKHLEDVRSLVNSLGDNPTQVKIDQARSAVEGLLDSVDKTELFEMVEAKQNALDTKVADAREAVEAISTPPTMEELATAQEKVNLLPTGDIKNDLQKQINEKKKQLDDVSDQLDKAEAAVTKAESFPTNYNVTIATKLVQALPSSEAKTALEERLQAIQNVFDLEKAETKVKQAEKYERDPYLTDAIQIVDALKDHAGKQALKDRLQVILDKLQAIKDAEEAAKNADGNYDPNDPTQTVEDAVDTIRDKEAKKYFTNWSKAVSNAENYFSKTTVRNATKYMDELPSAYISVVSYKNIIKELTERTNSLKTEDVIVDTFAPVEKAVSNYEKYLTKYYLSKAKELVESLKDSPEKTAFEIRLGMGDGSQTPGEQTEEEKLAVQLASVEKAMKNYEKFKTNFYQKKATEAVALMVDSEVKTAFQARLDAVIK